MSRIRSYEFYEVRSNINTERDSLHFRGAEQGARNKFATMGFTADDNSGNVYLLRVQVMEAIKADKK